MSPEPAGARWVASLDELLAVLGGATLLAVLFAARWFGVIRRPTRPDGAPVQSAVGAWDLLTVSRWLMVATAVAGIAWAISHRVRRAQRARPGPAAVVTGACLALASVTSLVLLDRVLIDPPRPATIDDVKLGAYVALLGAVAAALGVFLGLRHRLEIS